MTKLLTALLALSAAAGIFIVYTRPAYNTAKSIQGEITQYDAALDKSRELQELKRSLLSRYNTFSSDQLARLGKLLPDHIDNVRLTLDLDSMAARHGMAIQNVTLNTPTKKTDDTKKVTPTVIGALGGKQKTYESLTLQFVTAGTYSDFISFMNDLESSLRIVDIVGLTIEPSGGNSDTAKEPMYRYNVSIRTYWLK